MEINQIDKFNQMGKNAEKNDGGAVHDCRTMEKEKKLTIII